MPEKIAPVRIVPLSAIIWDNKDVPPGTTAIIDTFGSTSITLYTKVNRAASLILADVSRDKTSWRSVEALLKDFEHADSEFLSLKEYKTLKKQSVLMYRYLRVRIDSDAPVRVTLEMASKHVPWEAPFPEIVSEYPSFRGVTRGDLKEELELIAPVFHEILDYLTKIKEQLANADSWDHYHKTVTAAGTPVNLSALAIPDGCKVVVKSMHTNTGAIYLGKSEAAVKNVNKRTTLSRKNESTTFKVTNANSIWVDAGVNGEGVEYWSEEK